MPSFHFLRTGYAAFHFSLIAAACATLAACTKSESDNTAAKAPPATVVTLAPSREVSVQRTVEVVGTLVGDSAPTVSALVAGRVISIAHDLGDRVAPKELLAQIDPTVYDLAAQQQERMIQETLTKLGLVEIPTTPFDPEAVPTVARARLEAANAGAKFERGRAMANHEPPLISEQDFADLQTAFQVAESEHKVALLNVQNLLAQVKTGQANLAAARQKVLDAAAGAPELPNGSSTEHPSADRQYAIAERLVSIGDYVAVGTPMFRLVMDHPIRLQTSIPERFIARVAQGDEVRLTVEAYPQQFIGTVARISPRVDAESRAFLVEVAIPNEEGLLKAGSFAKASILTHIDESVTFVPVEAVTAAAGTKKVFTVANGLAVEHEVRTGIVRDDHVEILSGLSGSIEVVITGQSRLAMNTPVEVKSPEQIGAEPPTTSPSEGTSPTKRGDQ